MKYCYTCLKDIIPLRYLASHAHVAQGLIPPKTNSLKPLPPLEVGTGYEIKNISCDMYSMHVFRQIPMSIMITNLLSEYIIG